MVHCQSSEMSMSLQSPWEEKKLGEHQKRVALNSGKVGWGKKIGLHPLF